MNVVREAIISNVGVEDAKNILALQHTAYQSEAAIYNDYTIPPLKQTLEQLEEEFTDHIILKATVNDRIVGSVRGQVVDTTCHIGRLIVHPDYQGRGIGKRLMLHLESGCNVERYELFTGDKSKRNLHFYHALGYCEFRRQYVHPALSLIYLEKLRGGE